jgi:hypothetical protein
LAKETKRGNLPKVRNRERERVGGGRPEIK